MKIYKGVLIDQSVADPKAILDCTEVVSSRVTTLEGESFRGEVTFHNIEVSEDDLWGVLGKVAEDIKAPGWYFHLVDGQTLYIVLPRAILFAENNGDELNMIVEYAESQGIHPDQLNLKQLFENPYA
ncbi:hypothetical protein KDA11_01350 [Candidatus Saccharibacteria bacterium]|nr:hypothetical protein [Candidatus Saccharibacteria bacterium]